MALRITVHERDSSIEVILEGRLAGLWVAELKRAWGETAPRLRSRTVLLDLRNLIYSNEDGKRVLKEIVAQGNAKILASSPLTKHLAQEIHAPASSLESPDWRVSRFP